jgi:hypothetical protein
MEEQALVERTYVLDLNCLDAEHRQALEYVLADDSEKLKASEAKKVFAALRGAAEKLHGPLRDLPRCIPFTLC